MYVCMYLCMYILYMWHVCMYYIIHIANVFVRNRKGFWQERPGEEPPVNCRASPLNLLISFTCWLSLLSSGLNLSRNLLGVSEDFISFPVSKGGCDVTSRALTFLTSAPRNVGPLNNLSSRNGTRLSPKRLGRSN